MLAQGVSLNNAILDLHSTNSSNSNTKSSADLNQNQTDEKQMSSSQLNATNDSTIIVKQSDDSNKLDSNKELEPQKKEVEEFRKFILNSCQQNPNIIAAVAAAAVAAAAVQSSTSTLSATSNNDLIGQHIQHLIGMNNFKIDKKCDDIIQIDENNNNTISNGNDTNKEQNNDFDQQTRGEYRTSGKLKSSIRHRHHHSKDRHNHSKDRHHHHHHNRSNTLSNQMRNQTDNLKSISTASASAQHANASSSCSSSASPSLYSTSPSSSPSSSSSESSLSVSPPPPPLLIASSPPSTPQRDSEPKISSHKIFENKIYKPKSNQTDVNIKTGPLIQSMSVPRLPMAPTKKVLHDDYFYASNKMGGLSNQLAVNQTAAAASSSFNNSLSSSYNNIISGNNNSSTNSNNGGVSSEVKLKLKNAILQKLDKQNNLNGMNNSTSNNYTENRSANYLTETQNHSKQSQLLEMNQQQQQQQHHQQQLLNQHYLQFCHQFNDQNNNDTSKMNAPNAQLQILDELDENNLRRTNSEPNLKVKSALKDRLLEKRNLLNPFLAIKKGGQHQQKQLNKQNVTLASNPTQSYSPQNTNKNLSKLNNNNKKTLSPSCSMSSIPTLNHSGQFNQSPIIPSLSSSSLSALPLGNFQSQQQLNEQAIYSALAAAMSANANSSDNVNNQLAVAAASAFLNFNQQNDKSNKLQHKTQLQSQQNILASTLNQLALQQKMNNMQPQSFLDSLALAAAYVNHQSQMNTTNEKLSSLSFPILPNAMHSAFSTNKHQQNTNNIPRFGHAVHVEEENEMLLENELKIAAKLSDSQLKSSIEDNNNVNLISNVNEEDERDEFEDNVEMIEQAHAVEQNTPEHSHPEILNNLRNNILLNRSYSNYQQHHNANNNFHHHHLNHSRSSSTSGNNGVQFSYFNNQFFQHQNNIDKAQQQLLLLQQQQELEELKRQQQYHNNKISYFSDPHLLKSLEHASISSTANLNNSANDSTSSSKLKLKKSSIISTNLKQNDQVLFKPIISSSLTSTNQPMDCNTTFSSATQQAITSDADRVYRYTTGIVYDTAMLKHECTCNNPNNHLETADRIKSIWSRFKSRDLVDECEIVTSKLCSISDLLLGHSEQYSLIFGSDIETRPKLPKEYLQQYMMNVCLAPCRGFALTYDQDNSWNEEHTPIACRVAIGSTYELASLVSTGKLKNGFALVRPPGSHAEFNKPLGFCYFNTVAIVAKMLKKNLLLERILIVDWDVHHGNGTQQMTYTDPNIMYISLHRHDNGSFFPGTGAIDECGQDAGLGKNVNIAWNGKLNPAMGDTEYLAAFRCVVMPMAKAFKPQIILVSCGFDGTENHPKELGGYKLSPMCFAYMTKKLMSLAEGKVVLALEGGYDKQSLCDCSEMCINALMNRQIPSFPNQILDALPNSPAIQDLENVIDIQKRYWPSLNEYKKYIKMSHNQYISTYTE